MTCQSFHQVEIECDHKYRTYIQITTPDACMKVLGNADRTSVLSDSTISAIFVLLDSTKNRYWLGTVFYKIEDKICPQFTSFGICPQCRGHIIEDSFINNYFFEDNCLLELFAY